MGAAAGIIGIGTSLLGSMTAAQGAQQQGQAQQQMYDYQAGIARLNEKIAWQNENYARDIGELQSQQYGIGAGQRMGQIKSAQAGSGFDIRTGSPAAVQESQAQISRLDMTQIRSNAAKTAYNYDVQAQQFEEQANLYTLAGANAAQAGQINAQASILGGVSSVASQWLQGSKVGLFGNLGLGS